MTKTRETEEQFSLLLQHREYAVRACAWALSVCFSFRAEAGGGEGGRPTRAFRVYRGLRVGNTHHPFLLSRRPSFVIAIKSRYACRHFSFEPAFLFLILSQSSFSLSFSLSPLCVSVWSTKYSASSNKRRCVRSTRVISVYLATFN